MGEKDSHVDENVVDEAILRLRKEYEGVLLKVHCLDEGSMEFSVASISCLNLLSHAVFELIPPDFVKEFFEGYFQSLLHLVEY